MRAATSAATPDTAMVVLANLLPVPPIVIAMFVVGGRGAAWAESGLGTSTRSPQSCRVWFRPRGNCGRWAHAAVREAGRGVRFQSLGLEMEGDVTLSREEERSGVEDDAHQAPAYYA